ncbi:ribosomal protein L7Ae-like RNA K-turn-binding protein [Clostridium tetanomorphum]|uniref:50S ribosomal protein L7ae-like protein n=1 Tax=Clostridium tetanomorphum TaxID=1553 RepID=A0A923J2N4_CLOTT|nr:ribosomal L7Ae/L30e/S12e/Gadd45 family protein [Clostridium tetanomorphum]KAJ51566.1 ribosomal protein L7Ae family protein [Clostridium tetanomorphum DSM 665]MBC2398920.1 50S ribosomal protein L7ae-like protein [Clostridium tetanomorphum]MBP1865215.1 ribosomal protein L7Ae-like RNA K-turn-binding protein [Clostridium tetanomorphum]NRS84646.1 ribosomal protein L7Ae-like RNA K-turn-binding protein [Clostridium tetanomorphum]NRZ97861.1 ribosomal protein L7Ae-like RNA K-turn-binding protein [Cl
MKNKFISFLGIVKKAGKCIEGYNKCEEALRKDKCYLVIVSKEASQNTKEKFSRMALNRNIPVISECNGEDLCQILGRDRINIVGVSDMSMAEKLLELWEDKK